MPVTEWLNPALILALAGLVWRGFERLGSRVDRLESRIDRLDGKIDTLSEHVKLIAIDVAVLKDRADRGVDRPSRAASG
jgi:outer membrane murein-binding lipoprotein Lpp